MSKRIAMIFPGQGSQSIGMGKSFYENSEIAREMFDKAGERIGVDFKALLFEENEQINQTAYTQPAILLVSLIAYRLFQEACSVKPALLLGHSLGEFSAVSAEPEFPRAVYAHGPEIRHNFVRASHIQSV